MQRSTTTQGKENHVQLFDENGEVYRRPDLFCDDDYSSDYFETESSSSGDSGNFRDNLPKNPHIEIQKSLADYQVVQEYTMKQFREEFMKLNATPENAEQQARDNFKQNRYDLEQNQEHKELMDNYYARIKQVNASICMSRIHKAQLINEAKDEMESALHELTVKIQQQLCEDSDDEIQFQNVISQQEEFFSSFQINQEESINKNQFLSFSVDQNSEEECLLFAQLMFQEGNYSHHREDDESEIEIQIFQFIQIMFKEEPTPFLKYQKGWQCKDQSEEIFKYSSESEDSESHSSRQWSNDESGVSFTQSDESIQIQYSGQVNSDQDWHEELEEVESYDRFQFNATRLCFDTLGQDYPLADVKNSFHSSSFQSMSEFQEKQNMESNATCYQSMSALESDYVSDQNLTVTQFIQDQTAQSQGSTPFVCEAGFSKREYSPNVSENFERKDVGMEFKCLGYESTFNQKVRLTEIILDCQYGAIFSHSQSFLKYDHIYGPLSDLFLAFTGLEGYQVSSWQERVELARQILSNYHPVDAMRLTFALQERCSHYAPEVNRKNQFT